MIAEAIAGILSGNSVLAAIAGIILAIFVLFFGKEKLKSRGLEKQNTVLREERADVAVKTVAAERKENARVDKAIEARTTVERQPTDSLRADDGFKRPRTDAGNKGL